MGKGNVNNIKKTASRQCTGCGEKKDKKELIRVIKTPEGDITVDFTGKKNGRGAYICDDIKCLEKAIKTKRLERIFETNIDNKLYENIRGVIIERKKQNEDN